MKKFTLVSFLLTFIVNNFFGQAIYNVPLTQDQFKAYQKIQEDFYNSRSHTKNTPDSIAIQLHVIRNTDGTGGAAITSILGEISGVNEAIAATEAKLYVCQNIDYIDNSDYYHFKINQEQQITEEHNETGVINLYIPQSIDNGQVCGFSYIPITNRNHIFLSAQCFNQNLTENLFGTFFGLLPTYYNTMCNGPQGSQGELVDGSNCETAGDLICDTPADPVDESTRIINCEYRGTCTDANGDRYDPPTNNYMSIKGREPNCNPVFTPLQLERIAYGMEYERTRLQSDYCEPYQINTSLAELRENQIQLAPNPGYETLVITGLQGTENRVLITDALGKSIHNIPIKHRKSLSVAMPVPAGVYWVHIHDNNRQRFTKKWLKQ